MENNVKSENSVQGAQSLQEMENNLIALEEALNGIRTAFGILSDFHAHCRDQYQAAVPEREEVS